MAEIVWLLEATIRAIHYRQIAEHVAVKVCGMKDYFRPPWRARKTS